ncbi:MAG: flagellar motor switch protein FliN [Phycisphaerae bacterium]|nr:flagellar motor switch protein FliN [Phycisphaerae bacterium]
MMDEARDDAKATASEAAVAAGAGPGPSAPRSAPPPDATPFQMPVFAPVDLNAAADGLDLLGDVDLDVSIELGRTRMLVEDVLRLGDGAVVELDKLAGDPVDVYVNGRHIARGEVLVLNDNFCVRVNEIIDPAAE